MEKEKSINRNGVSVCATGQENYTTFTEMGNRMRGTVYIQFDTKGELFACFAKTFEEYIEKRDKW